MCVGQMWEVAESITVTRARTTAAEITVVDQKDSGKSCSDSRHLFSKYTQNAVKQMTFDPVLSYILSEMTPITIFKSGRQ